MPVFRQGGTAVAVVAASGNDMCGVVLWLLHGCYGGSSGSRGAEGCRCRAADFGRMLLHKQFSYPLYCLVSNSYLMSSSENKEILVTVFLSMRDQAEIGIKETNH